MTVQVESRLGACVLNGRSFLTAPGAQVPAVESISSRVLNLNLIFYLFVVDLSSIYALKL